MTSLNIFNNNNEHVLLLFLSTETTPHLQKALALTARVRLLDVLSKPSFKPLIYKGIVSTLKTTLYTHKKKANRSFSFSSFFCWTQKLTSLIAFSDVHSGLAGISSRAWPDHQKECLGLGEGYFAKLEVIYYLAIATLMYSHSGTIIQVYISKHSHIPCI